jgi:hypothetical protein
MPSPFPGMNPYLEQADVWQDFHQAFIAHARDALVGAVGGNYFVKIEVQLILHELPPELPPRYVGRTDIGVTGPPTFHAASEPATVAAPVELELPAIEVERLSSLEIRDRRDRRLVTVVELLSPSNKKLGTDRDAYLRKRKHLLDDRVHLVELDLRRGGERPRPPDLPPCDYYALVSRCEARPKIGFWPLNLRDQLPVLPIPLTAPDPDALLDVQAMLHRVYDGAGYANYIYGATPEPPLSADDAAWARQFLPG